MKKKKQLNRYLMNLLLTTVFGGVIGLINYLFNIFIARFTTEDIFGLYSAAIGVIYLIQIPGLSIQNILTKIVGENKKVDVQRLKWTSTVIFTVVGFIFSILFLFIIPIITDPTQISRELILPLSITLLLTLLSPIAKGVLLGREKVMLVNFILLAETLVRFAIGFVGIKMGGNLAVLILANAIPAFLSFVITLPFIRSPKSHKKKIKIPYKQLILMAVSLLLLSVPYTLDLVLTPEFFKAEYGALSLTGKIVYFASITVASVMLARLANEKEEKEDYKILGKTVLLTFVIGILASLALYIFRDLIIDLAFGGKYGSTTVYFAIFGLIMSAYAIVYLFANFFFLRNSYLYILVLLAITILQFWLFSRPIESIFDIVCNQILVYTILLVSTVTYFLFNFIFKSDGKKDKKAG